MTTAALATVLINTAWQCALVGVQNRDRLGASLTTDVVLPLHPESTR